MSFLNIGLKFGEELPPRVREELDHHFAALAAWANDPNLIQLGYGTFQQPHCRYYLQNGAAQTLANNTSTMITWSDASNEVKDEDYNAVQFDNGERYGHKFLQADGPYLCPPVPGRYLVTAGVAFEANATGRRDASIVQRVSDMTVIQVASANQFYVTASALAYLHLTAVLVVSDFSTSAVGVGLQVLQTSGGALDAWPGPSQTYLSLLKVS